MGDLDSVYANLKACLISCKGGIPLKDLESEYFKLNGERTAFKSYGFSSLEDLLRASDKFIFQNHGGVSIVQASYTQKTQHLSDLIRKQKSKPIKRFTVTKAGSRSINTSSNPNRLNNYSRQGNSNSSYGPPKNRYNNASIPNNTNSHKTSTSNCIKPNQQKAHPANNYSRSTNNPRNHQANSGTYVGETKVMQQHNLLNDNTNFIQTDPTTNVIHPLHINNKSHTKPAQKFPLTTSSSSSLESAYSSSSASYIPKPPPINSLDKLQLEKDMNISVPQINLNNKEQIPKNDIHTKVNEKNSEHKSQTQHQQHKPISTYPSTNMPFKSSTAQSRLQKYPKKCDETLNKVDGEKTITTEGPIQSNNSFNENNQCVEENDHDYIEELESYLKNLNLPEPYYDSMVKKEKHGKTIRHLHISTIKINEKNISSFPVECNTVDYAKKIAAKHALTILKKQYGENIVYPIASDINTMAFNIKDFLKSGFEETGLMGDVLERMYREKFQENLPDNWVQLLEVFSCFTFDKLVANKIIIYLNEMDNDNHQNGHGDINEYTDASIEDDNIIPGTPLKFEDYKEKSVLVSANYGSSNIWIRFVGQSVDEKFIQMQAKFNDAMNTTGFSIAEQVTRGEYYAVLYNSIWHRVQISSPTREDGSVTCFMVDTGELYNVAKDQICNLEPVYMKTKFQAIECILTHFDNFGTFDGLKELLNEMILNKTFFVIPDSLEDSPRITLYEKGESSNRINVNDMIMQRFLKKTVARLPHFEEHTLVDAVVSSFVESGHLYLQLNFDVISFLEEFLPNDECIIPEYFIKSKKDIKKDQVYLMKYEDDIWCRIQIIEIINESEVKVIYIDYGNVSKCKINQLVDLELFDPLMAKIPPQALKVSMNMIPPKLMTTDIAKKLFNIIGNDRVLVNEVNGNAAIDGVPFIQLYKSESPEEITSGLCLNVQMFQSLNKQ